MLKNLMIGCASVAMLLAAVPAQASITGKVEVKLLINAGCEVTSGSTVAGNLNDFGTLDFGRTAPIWRNVLGAEAQGSGTAGPIQVTCDSTINSFNVNIDGGLRGDRTLKHATAADKVSYNVFRDAARTVPYVANTPQAFATTGAPVAVPVYGAIAPNATAKAAGAYSDTLMVTLTF